MKELDFDELDRAVSSLMGGMAKTDLDAPKPDTTKTLTLHTTLQGTEKIELNKLHNPSSSSEAKKSRQDPKKVAPKEIDAPEPVVETDEIEAEVEVEAETPSAAEETPVVARKGGRFMDVVHVSSDMKTATNATFTRPPRSGVTIEPREATGVIEEITPPAPPSVLADAEPAETALPEETVSQENAWPDPLELTSFQNEDETSLEPVVDFELPEEEPAVDPEEELDFILPIESPPLTSPFLQDTKVEKRPLGNGALPPEQDFTFEDSTPVPPVAEPLLATNEREDIERGHDVEAQLPPSQAAPEMYLPEELQGDLMAVESDTTTRPLTEANVPTISQDVIRTKTVPVFARQTSINQQYSEAPSTGDQENGSIYDTDSYHQPLSHPVKNKSGWMLIVWILLILLVGAASGAALYFSGII